MKLGPLFSMLAASTMIATVPVEAKDSVAELRADGLGLVMRQTRSVEMAEKDLLISPDEVRVRHLFRNHADRDIETIVASAMPDVGPEPGADFRYAKCTCRKISSTFPFHPTQTP